MTDTYLEERSRRGTRSRLVDVMAKVSDIEPEEVDIWPGEKSGD